MKAMGKSVKGGSSVIDCFRGGKGDFALVEFRTLAEVVMVLLFMDVTPGLFVCVQQASGAMMLHGTMFEGKAIMASRLDGFADPPIDMIQRFSIFLPPPPACLLSHLGFRLIGTGIVGSPGDLCTHFHLPPLNLMALLSQPRFRRHWS